MYETLVSTEYQLPVELDSQVVIKANSLDQAFALNEKLQQEEAESAEKIAQETQLALNNIAEEKALALIKLEEQVATFSTHQQEAMQQIEQACGTILKNVLTRFHSDVTVLDKLNFSVQELLKSYQHKNDVCLVVQSMTHFKQCHVALPEDWELKEDPFIDTECQLSMSNGEIVCNFDAIYTKITDEITAINY